MPAHDDNSFMKLGKILRPHGIRGELRLQVMTAYPERIPYLETIYLAPERRPHQRKAYTLVKARFHRDLVLLTLEGIESRTDADTLRGQVVSVPFDEGAPLEAGEFYVYQMIGMDVYTLAGEWLGQIERIFETGANDVFIVKGGSRGEVLIPDIEDVVKSISLENKRVDIDPIPGLLDDPLIDNLDTAE